MRNPLRVLMVEDSPDDAELVCAELREAGYDIDFERVETESALQRALARQAWDVVISDYRLPRFSAPAALAVVRESGADLPFIIVSGTIGEDVAVASMKAGVDDYLMKDKLARLALAVERAVRDAGERRARREVEAALQVAEAELRQSQKLEAIGQLAGGIAHDLNNLLTVITGYSELLLMELPADTTQRLAIEEIAQAGESAAALTHQLLAFSRRQVLSPVTLVLNDALRSMERLLRRLIGEDVELVTVPDPEGARISVDPGQLEQVILNLALNARDAMPDGGKLTLEAASVVVDPVFAARHAPMPPGAYVMLAVSDTGSGMDATIQGQIFEPFFTTKPEGRGTGLGLSTVYGIVKQSGGYVTVDSEPGRGSTFTLYLPRVENPSAPGEAPAAAAAPVGGTETVLLVEDADQVRTLAQTVLEVYGYTVLVAASAEDALRVSAEHPQRIDLLLTDVVMPGSSGRELAERLRAQRPDIRVLYMSGYGQQIVARRGVLEPGVALLTKPFTPVTLTHQVRAVLHAEAGA